MECAGPVPGLGVFAGDLRPIWPVSSAEESLAVIRTLPRHSRRAPAGSAASILTLIDPARLSRQLFPSAMRHAGFLPALSAPASCFDEAPQCAAYGSHVAIAL